MPYKCSVCNRGYPPPRNCTCGGDNSMHHVPNYTEAKMIDVIRELVHALPDEHLKRFAGVCSATHGSCFCGCHVSQVCEEPK
jgi:hypothetical protein